MKRLAIACLLFMGVVGRAAEPALYFFQQNTNDFIIDLSKVISSPKDVIRLRYSTNGTTIIVSNFFTTNITVNQITVTTNITINGTNVPTINPTVGRLPYRSGTNVFSDSSLYYVDDDSVGTSNLHSGTLVVTNANGYGPMGVGSDGYVTNMAQPMYAASFGATGNGLSNDSAALQSAMTNSAGRGGRVYIGPTTLANIVVTNAIHWIGFGGVKMYDTNFFNSWFIPADTNDWALKLGDGTSLVRGAVIEDVTFYNPSGGGFGVYVNSGFEVTFRNCAFFNFATNVLVEASATQPASIIIFENCWFQQQNTDNTVGINLVMPAAQTQYTTAINFVNCHINGLTAGGLTNAYARIIDGTVPTDIGCYFDLQGGEGKGQLLRKTYAGVLDPYIISAGSVYDGGLTETVLEIDPSYGALYPYDKIKGTYVASGLIKNGGGDYYTLPSSAFSGAQLFGPTLLSSVYFARGSAFTNTGELYMVSDASDGLTIHSTNQINISAGAASGVSINSLLGVHGNLYVSQPYSIRGYDTNGVDHLLLGIGGLNNVQLNSPYEAGTMAFLQGTNGAGWTWQSRDTDLTNFTTRASLTGDGQLTVTSNVVANGSITANNGSENVLVIDPSTRSMSLYNTFSGANYERIHSYWVGNNFIVDSQANGAGTVRNMFLQRGGLTYLSLQSSGLNTVQPFISTSTVKADGGFIVGAQTGITTTVDTLVAGGTTNRLVYTGGILVSNIANFYSP